MTRDEMHGYFREFLNIKDLYVFTYHYSSHSFYELRQKDQDIYRGIKFYSLDDEEMRRAANGLLELEWIHGHNYVSPID